MGAGLAGCTDLKATVRGTPAPIAADSRLVDQAGIALSAALSLLHRTTTRHPGLGSELAPLRVLHTTHLDALRSAASSASPTPAPDRPSTTPAVPVPARRGAALAAVRDAERALRARLTGLAQDATSGDLARLLGAMAAATAQRSVVADRAREQA